MSRLWCREGGRETHCWVFPPPAAMPLLHGCVVALLLAQQVRGNLRELARSGGRLVLGSPQACKAQFPVPTLDIMQTAGLPEEVVNEQSGSVYPWLQVGQGIVSQGPGPCPGVAACGGCTLCLGSLQAGG